VAVKLIIDRENEIKQFTPEEYWSIEGDFLKGKKKFQANFYGLKGKKTKLGSKEDVDTVLKQLSGDTFTVDSVVKKERKRNPAVPFTTSSLQQEAARKLNFRARTTMMIAQQLYEGIEIGKEGTVGLITYMRTDSTRISEVAQKEAAEFIESKYGKEFVNTTTKQKKSDNKTQDAHEAVRPTSTLRIPSEIKKFLSRDQYRLYKLI